MKHFTFSTLHIHLFFSIFLLLCLCFPTHSHAQATRKKWKALKAQADSLGKQGKYQEVLPLWVQAKDLALQKWGKWSKEYVISLINLGEYYYASENPDKCLIYLTESLPIIEKVYGEKTFIYAKVLNSLGLVYDYKGNYSKALDVTIKSTNLIKELQGDTSSIYFLLLNNIGRIYYGMNEYNESMKYLTLSLSLTGNRFGESSEEYANVLFHLAKIYCSVNENNKCLECHKQCVNIVKKLDIKDYTYTQYLFHLAAAYRRVGNYEMSLRIGEECEKLSEKLMGKNSYLYALSLESLASSYFKMNNYIQALSLYKKTLMIMEHHDGKNNNDIISVLGNIGNCYFKELKYREALEVYDKCLILTDSLLEKNDLMYPKILHNSAAVYCEMGDYNKAISFYHEALIFREKHLGISNIDCGNTLMGLYINHWKTHNKLLAATTFSKSCSIYISYYITQSTSLSESDRAQFWATLKDNYETYHSFCLDAKDSIPEVVAQAYNNQLNTAGILLQGTEKVKQAIQSSGDSSLLQLYETWRIQKKQIANWTTWDSLRLANSGIDLKAEEEKANEWEQELARKSVEFREATDTTAITWQQVQQSLQAGDAAVEIVRFRKYNRDFTDTVYYAALVLTPETKENPIYVFLPNGNKMDSLWFNKYREYIEKHSKTNHINEEDTVHYARYLKAILAACGNATHIYFAADGVYHKLNLNTFWTEKGQYVAQQWQIHQLASTRELVKKNQEKPIPTQLTAALFGNPSFDMNKEEWLQAAAPYHQGETASIFRGGLEGDREENLKALPGAEEEVKAVGELLKNKGFEVKTYLNKMALEEEIQALKSPTIVLFATHGSFQAGSSMPKSTGYNIANDPMYQSVLFFAGAKNTLSDSLSLEKILAAPEHEDGILHAAEAANLRLEGTELVVLSACETGLGQIQNGEGVYGLQRAFRIAGAKDLLMSLWKVDDQASKEFTTLFFQNWIDKKMSKYEAYRITQLALIQKYPHEPKKWGGFILMESNPSR